MPLGKTETVSSMAGPKSVTVYDTEDLDFLNRMITESDMAINQTKRSKTLSDLDKYKRIETLQDNKKRHIDRLKMYTSDPRFRAEYKNKLGMLGGESANSITPDVGPLKQTKTMSSPSARVDAPDEDTFSRATTTKNKRIDKVTFAGQSDKAVADALKEHGKKTLDALKEDPFIYGKQGVEEAVKRGYLSPDIAGIYENEGEDAARKAMGLGKNPLAWEDLTTPKSKSKAKMDQTIKQLEGFLEDLDKEIAAEASQKNKVVELPTPKKKKSLAGVFKGLGRATVAGLAEAPAFEFLSPPSAGPSDPEDPVNQYERGQMSQEDFDEFTKQAAKTRKKTNYFDPLQTMVRGLQGK